MKTNIKKILFIALIIIPAAVVTAFTSCDSGGSGGTISPDKPIMAQDVCTDFNGGTGSLCDDFNSEHVDSDVWQVATWYEHDGQTGPERCYVKNGILNMIFINSSENGFLSAAIQTREEFGYGRWEARIKPTSVPGVLNSFYTIDWDDTDVEGDGDGSKEEIDIEFLTKSFGEDTGEVHFAVHADGSTSHDTNPDIDLDFNPSDEPHVWGFEITPEHIQWFVNGNVQHTYTYSDIGNDIIIDETYQLKLNVWSEYDGWIGGPPEEYVQCLYQIDWITFTPYIE